MRNALDKTALWLAHSGLDWHNIEQTNNKQKTTLKMSSAVSHDGIS